MKLKRIKQSILIFISGLIIGINVNSLINKSFKKIIISPISPTLAETRKFILPLSEGEILGISTKTSQNKLKVKKEKVKRSSQFANLINQSILTPGVDEETPGVNFNWHSGKITIAVIGDSMTDLMGPNLPYLKTALQKYYPQVQFNLLNYGVGAENIEKGLKRIKKEYTYQGRHYPALVSINPDIVVIESFAYNPFRDSTGELDRHWSALVKIVDFIKSNTRAKIIILATIAPTKEKFGQGPNGVNWLKDLAWQHANRIGQYLENTVRFAQSANLPLVDVYHQTLLPNGGGNLAYINPGDHIHQNEAGNKLIAKLLAEKIFQLNLIP